MRRATLILLFAACAPLPEGYEESAATEEAIGSTTNTVAGPTKAATVVLSSTSICTGTVLTDHWILTAAHCFLHDAPGQLMMISAADANGGPNIQLYNDTVEYFRHPSWGWDEDKSIGHDLQLVYLPKGAIPSTFPNRGLLLSDSAHPWYGSSCLPAVYEGFGEGPKPGSLASCGGSNLLRRKEQVPMSGSSSNIAISSAQAICPGDSGGPWMFLMDGKLVQFAVTHGHNWGGICGGDIFSVYDTGATISSGLAWIQETLKSKGPITITNGTAASYAYQTYKEGFTCVPNKGAQCTKMISCGCKYIDGTQECCRGEVYGTVSCSGSCVTSAGCAAIACW